MADEERKDECERGIRPELFGRLPIYTTIERFNPDDEAQILEEVNSALSIHGQNVNAMDYLLRYRKGFTPVLARTKKVRPDICAKINVNYADEIATFKGGFFLTQPCFYIGKTEDAQKGAKELNDFIVRSGKQKEDNKLVDWFDTVGKANLFVRANDDPRVPFKAFALDPRAALVARSLSPGNDPVFGLYIVVRNGRQLISLWDDTSVYTIEGAETTKNETTVYPGYTLCATRVIDRQDNPLGKVPIIEYYYNRMYMASFEAALPLIDAASFLQSDRLDAVDQAVQSLLVFYNCELEDEDGKPTGSREIREAGALFLKSVGENKADLKEIVTNLDQSQTQVFLDNLRDQILAVSAMPNTNTRSSHNAATGSAALIMDNWYQAETAARNTEDLFKESNAYFDEIVLHILREKKLLDIDQSEIELQIPRNDTANAQSKAQTFQTYMAGGLAPVLALSKSGASSDPIADYEQSKGWIKLRWGDPDAVVADPTMQPQQPTGTSPLEGAKDGNFSGNGGSTPGQVAAYYQTRNGKRVLIDSYQKRVKPKVKQAEEKPE